MPGVTLVRTGGHFPGSAVLHWAGGAEGRGALLVGDSITVVPDRRYVSFMYSYPNLIPASAESVRAILASVEPYAFDRIYGGWWDRDVTDGRQGRRPQIRGALHRVSPVRARLSRSTPHGSAALTRLAGCSRRGGRLARWGEQWRLRVDE